MKTLIKRLLGITRLENEIIGSHAEIKAMADVILTTRTELAYYKGLVEERYETEWKITKDGKRRYRKIATKVLVNAWHTESEPLRCDECGDENLHLIKEGPDAGYYECAGSCALHKFH
jgi:hypothetical protein